MTAAEFLEKEAKRFNMALSKAWDGDFDLRPDGTKPSGADLIQLCAILDEVGYVCSFQRDNSIHIHAPHRKSHNWGDRGWDCTHGLTVQGCEAFHGPATIDQKLKAGLRGRQLNQGS